MLCKFPILSVPYRDVSRMWCHVTDLYDECADEIAGFVKDKNNDPTNI